MSILPPQKKILLVVEDSRLSAQIIRGLGEHGFLAKAGANVTDVIKKAELFLPHVVLLEILGARKSGFAAAIKLRKLPGLKTVHLIAMTASNDAEILTNLAAAGFDELLPMLPTLDRIMLSCN